MLLHNGSVYLEIVSCSNVASEVILGFSFSMLSDKFKLVRPFRMILTTVMNSFFQWIVCMDHHCFFRGWVLKKKMAFNAFNE